MKSFFYHIQININFENISFYKDLLKFLGWSVIFEQPEVIGFKSGTNGDLWFVSTKNSAQSDYDTIGVNHISIRVENKVNVDETVEFLQTKKIKPLFETPRHRPEFANSDKKTYYQVIFVSPDNIQFEIVYIGSK